jgi:hypothetical protein
VVTREVGGQGVGAMLVMVAEAGGGRVAEEETEVGREEEVRRAAEAEMEVGHGRRIQQDYYWSMLRL